jgi:hypothetical protein
MMHSGVLLDGYNVHLPSGADARGPLSRYVVRVVLRGLIVGVLLFAALSLPSFQRLQHEKDCFEAEWIPLWGNGGDFYTERIPRFLVHMPPGCD